MADRIADQPNLQAVQTDEDENTTTIDEPAKILRIAAMINGMLNEVHEVSTDEEGRRRLRTVYDKSIVELKDALGDDLSEELESMTLPFDEDVPSEAELRIAQAQLTGWLQGLFRGIQATFAAQQMQTQRQLGALRQRPQMPTGPGQDTSTGQYL